MLLNGGWRPARRFGCTTSCHIVIFVPMSHHCNLLEQWTFVPALKSGLVLFRGDIRNMRLNRKALPFIGRSLDRIVMSKDRQSDYSLERRQVLSLPFNGAYKLV